MCILPPIASKAMAASKQPQRSYHLRFEISNLDYPGIHVHIASNSHFDCLLDHGGLQTASEVTFDLGIELSDLNYLGIHVHIASNSHFGGL